MPLVASHQNVEPLMDTGIHGIAVSGLLTHSDNPTELIKHLNENYMSTFKIGDKSLASRLFFRNRKIWFQSEMEEAILASGSRNGYSSIKRIDLETEQMLLYHISPHIHLLPNTSGARNAKKLFFAATGKRSLRTNWLKLEIHPDPKYLMPDAIETLKATEALAKALSFYPTFTLILFYANI
jgi:thiazole synthase ThiGH ThiG subunit